MQNDCPDIIDKIIRLTDLVSSPKGLFKKLQKEETGPLKTYLTFLVTVRKTESQRRSD